MKSTRVEINEQLERITTVKENGVHERETQVNLVGTITYEDVNMYGIGAKYTLPLTPDEVEKLNLLFREVHNRVVGTLSVLPPENSTEGQG